MRNPRESQYSNGAIPPDPEEARQLNALHGPIPQPSRLLKGTAAVLGLGTVVLVVDACAREAPAAVVEVNPISGTITDITVRRGETLTFKASGEWCIGPGVCGGPDGIRPANPDEPDVILPTAKMGALIGIVDAPSINNKHFLIGSNGKITAERDGKLDLGMNDRACCEGDNTGSVKVKIFRQQSGSAPQIRETPRPVQPTPEQRIEAGWQVYRDMNLPVEISYHPDLFNKLQSKAAVREMGGYDIPIASISVIMLPVNPWVRLEDILEQTKRQSPEAFGGERDLNIVGEQPITVGGSRGFRREYTYTYNFRRVSQKDSTGQFKGGGGWYYDHIYTIQDITIRNGKLWTLKGEIHFFGLDGDREPSPASVNNRDKYLPVLRGMLGSIKFVQ